MTDKRASVIWQDVNGLTRQTIITTLAGSAAIQTAALACSDAGILTAWESALAAAAGSATAAQYQSVKSAAQLTFQTASGSILRLTLPAPPLAVLKADKLTVDPAAAAIVTLVAACVGSLSDGAGNAATGYLGGVMIPTRNDLPPIG